MRIATKKLKSGFAMPVFGVGTWRMGGELHYDPNNDDEADIRALKSALDAGVTHIDTAEKYADGHAEEIVAKAIKGYDRAKLFIVSKVDFVHLKYDDVLKACANSLKRLEVNYLDLYLIHSPNSQIPIKETMKALDKLKSGGLIKEIGVSNFSVARMKDAQACSKNKIVANQVHFNLMIREVERTGLLKYCQENDIMLIAYRPLEKGMLMQRGGSILDELYKKYKKTQAQIAINWLISQDNVVTLSKMRDLKHIEENLGALDWTMDREDIELLRTKFPDQKDVSNVIPLS